MATPAQFGAAVAEDSSGDIWFACQMLCRWNGSSISITWKSRWIIHPVTA